jgi:hypothetical protein
MTEHGNDELLQPAQRDDRGAGLGDGGAERSARVGLGPESTGNGRAVLVALPHPAQQLLDHGAYVEA